jgi:hypothetical protein
MFFYTITFVFRSQGSPYLRGKTPLKSGYLISEEDDLGREETSLPAGLLPHNPHPSLLSREGKPKLTKVSTAHPLSMDKELDKVLLFVNIGMNKKGIDNLAGEPAFFSNPDVFFEAHPVIADAETVGTGEKYGIRAPA